MFSLTYFGLISSKPNCRKIKYDVGWLWILTFLCDVGEKMTSLPKGMLG